METEVKSGISFDEFNVDPIRRLVTKRGEALNLSPKTFDLLLALIDRPGEIVSKDEPMDAVWGGQFVEEGNLTVNISLLRKALGENKNEHRYIVTVPGVGYSFVAEIEEEIGKTVKEDESQNGFVFGEEIANAAINQNGAGSKPESLQLPVVPVSKLNRNKLWFLAGFAAITLLVGFLIWHYYDTSSGLVAKWINPFPESIKARQLTANGNVLVAALSPDGNFFAYVIEEKGRSSLWLEQLDGNQKVQIRPFETIIYDGLTFSPDGGQVYYPVHSPQFSQGALFRQPVLGGVPENFLELPDETVFAFDFSPDGKKIAVAHGELVRDVILISAFDRRD